MSNNDINKAYVSPYDEFLAEFDATHRLSSSQQAEIKKAQRIAYYRDNAVPSDQEGEIWEGF